MSTSQKLSLPSAILININIMIGTGLFINTVLLAQGAGAASPLVYALIGLLISPLIATFSQLLRYHPGGNFYDFAQALHPFAGFISLWSYFNSKMASATLGIHVFVSLLQKIFPVFGQINTLLLDSIIIALFMMLNTLNMRIGRKIQYSFIIMKMIPILFAIIAGILLFNPIYLTEPISWPAITTTIPFALYAITGFEAICSLGSKILHPEKNAPRAVIISFFSVVGIIIAYQLMFYASLGSELAHLPSYLEAFPTLIHRLFDHHQAPMFLQMLLHIGIAASALGVAYGIMYSNSWNLYNLAKRNLMIAPRFFTHLNRHQVPTRAILAEGILAYFYIVVTGGYQIPFQQISAAGLTITYLLSCIGLLVYTYRSSGKMNFIALLGLMSCSLLMLAQMQNVYRYGIRYLAIFLALMLIGCIIFYIKRRALTDFER